jgi:hypothetical protein
MLTREPRVQATRFRLLMRLTPQAPLLVANIAALGKTRRHRCAPNRSMQFRYRGFNRSGLSQEGTEEVGTFRARCRGYLVRVAARKVECDEMAAALTGRAVPSSTEERANRYSPSIRFLSCRWGSAG